MPPSYFPLRWESTGDKWWYASPIDWAAANGLYDLVIELLHLDNNLLIKLTSLRRIRRLETVWDDEDEESQFADVAKCRSLVARRLLRECETKKGGNTLVRSGYGGWLMYTAASAGDINFVKELLEKDPFLVFGEGEYGVTDMFYAAARGGNSEVFKMLLDFAVSSRSCLSGSTEREEVGDKLRESNSVFKWEMTNRAVHAAARGGSLEILKEILKDCGDVLVYRDVKGSTILHSASGRGQVQVVKDLVASYNIITSIDNQGNTALHVAAYRGYSKVVEFLIHSSPNSASAKNNSGNTFLHMVVSGFRTPDFQRMDQQTEMMKQLVRSGLLLDIINVRNLDGRTALHMAVTENVQSEMVELLMTVKSIDLNVLDFNGMTPLDLLRRRPKSVSSEVLIKELTAAGGIVTSNNVVVARSAIVSHLREQKEGIGGSPGTSFRIPDAEIFLYTGTSEKYSSYDDAGYSSCMSEVSDMSLISNNSSDNKKSSSITRTASRLKFLFQWPGKKERKAGATKPVDVDNDDDDDPLEAEITSDCRNWSEVHIPLRQKYSKNNKLRAFSMRSDLLPSRSTRKKFTTGLSHGVIQAAGFESPRSPFSGSNSSRSINPSFSTGKTSHDEMNQYHQKQTSIDKRLMMNQYFCFGAQGLDVEGNNKSYTRLDHSIKSVSSLVA